MPIPTGTVYIPGVTGADGNVLTNMFNSGPGDPSSNPQGEQPVSGGETGMDDLGALITGGQNPGPCTVGSGMSGSGLGFSDACMSDNQQNANPCNIECTGPECLGCPCEVTGQSTDPTALTTNDCECSMLSLTGVDTSDINLTSLTDLGFTNPATQQATGNTPGDGSGAGAGAGGAMGGGAQSVPMSGGDYSGT